MATAYDPNRVLTIHYTNHRGESGMRRIVPIGVRFDVSPWHGADPMWLMDAHDVDRGTDRTFAMRGMMIFGSSSIVSPGAPGLSVVVEGGSRV